MTPPLGTVQVILNKRTLRIGHQTYQLQNLARVQTVRLPKPLDAEKGNSALAVLTAVGVLVVAGIISGAAQTEAICGLGVPLAIGLAIFVYLRTKKTWVPLYALVLETTGNPVTALVSPDSNEMEHLSGEIVEAIENPPEVERILQVNNVTLGDQYNQSGTQNIGRIGGAV
ncbi:hypothetical protein CryarDRAFT_0095 [Cryptosporangium arvum DSM 44712]|uniref:Uncharacterized protein n=1 Tax=Cryptosporangium arvum DSM 44712 TaxID=927661 RepID=A0A011AAM8_9ACTN|nr:hypothetical protein CryarDRAFT_0095 [Cryptosporangium arvum DSM 44712]